MKYKNVTIFFIFVLLFLFRNSVDEFLISFLQEPEVDESFVFVTQNLENDLKSLEEEMGILRNVSTNIIFSKVLFHDPYAFFDTLKILKGTNQDLSLNMAVVSKNQLIGVISSLEENASYVRLLTNPESSVSVRIHDSYGIMTTNEDRECVADFSSSSLVEIGDEVVTSGLTNIPSNIPIGNVSEVIKDELGLITQVKITLSATFSDISYVTLVGKGEVS